ncbi:uncharacterized protein LOC114268450 [Camellia sinensis]|uniref:uncharacterized protein LOC114268450 n=1 Tax=Camellia sinensis TaxID=4442 RepID=UPI0010363F20|nr:uncharacterized protein LOC114268450 [Camellia sinensis]
MARRYNLRNAEPSGTGEETTAKAAMTMAGATGATNTVQGDPFAKRNKDFSSLGGQKFSGDEGAIAANAWVWKCEMVFRRIQLIEDKKNEKFIKGLNHYLSKSLIPFDAEPFDRVLDLALKCEENEKRYKEGKTRGRVLYADLIMLWFERFAIILGMDWLRKHFVILDCAGRIVNIDIPGMPWLTHTYGDGGESVITHFLCSVEIPKQDISEATYRITPKELVEIKKQLEKMLQKWFIRSSNSLWRAPAIFVSKKDGTLCTYIDYSELNKESISLIAFWTWYGLYEFPITPFGLINALAYFMDLINGIFQSYLDKFVIIFIEDILVYSKNEKKHREQLKVMLQTLREQ